MRTLLLDFGIVQFVEYGRMLVKFRFSTIRVNLQPNAIV